MKMSENIFIRSVPSPDIGNPLKTAKKEHLRGCTVLDLPTGCRYVYDSTWWSASSTTWYNILFFQYLKKGF